VAATEGRSKRRAALPPRIVDGAERELRRVRLAVWARPRPRLDLQRVQTLRLHDGKRVRRQLRTVDQGTATKHERDNAPFVFDRLDGNHAPTQPQRTDD
jgi:hypothetical protein